jgi:hypothetical protein
LLDQLSDHALQGRLGIALLEGVAGVGKTGLLRSWAETARSCGLRVCSATCLSSQREYAFSVARQLLAPLVRGITASEETTFSGAPGPAVRYLTLSGPVEDLSRIKDREPRSSRVSAP